MRQRGLRPDASAIVRELLDKAMKTRARGAAGDEYALRAATLEVARGIRSPDTATVEQQRGVSSHTFGR